MPSVTPSILDVVNAGAFLLCVCFIAYVVLIVVPFVRHAPAELGDGRDFDWHFLVPCLNEAAVIEATVRRSGGRWVATSVERSGGGGNHDDDSDDDHGGHGHHD